ncbi:hypothetical protein DFH09DRAFT_1095058 [Mycena vulgaris]|nr:hypothetical protein DFH09DRAFT_1095058 [Mycena vulgaris]
METARWHFLRATRMQSRLGASANTIFPSEICDERTASRLGWFNAARRSSILPENLIGCARLYDYYTNGISEGAYSHEAHVALSEVLAPTAGTTLTKSAPSLMDLIHEVNVSPSEIDKEALEELLFQNPDPYDLVEAERVDLSDPRPAMARSSTVFAVADYVKLDSPELAELLQPSKLPESTVATPVDDSQVNNM